MGVFNLSFFPNLFIVIYLHGLHHCLIFCFSLFIILQLSHLFIFFAPLHPAHPSRLQSIPLCCPCPWVIHTCSLTAPFPFLPPFPLSLLPSCSCQSVPCFCVSGSILLDSLFCSLDSHYKWGHMVFVFHCLAYFTWHNSFQLHPCCCKRWTSFFLLHSILLCKCTTFFLIQSSTQGHLGCFQHLAIVNRAAMNTGVCKLFWIDFSGFLGYITSSVING